MNHTLLFILITLILIVGAGSSFALWNKQSEKENEVYTEMKIQNERTEEQESEASSIRLKEVGQSQMASKTVVTGEEFTVFDEMESEVRNDPFVLVSASGDTIELDRIVLGWQEDINGQAKLAPTGNIERITVTQNTCIEPMALMLDVRYELCLTTKEESGVPTLEYEIKGYGTMPGPSN